MRKPRRSHANTMNAHGTDINNERLTSAQVSRRMTQQTHMLGRKPCDTHSAHSDLPPMCSDVIAVQKASGLASSVPPAPPMKLSAGAARTNVCTGYAQQESRKIKVPRDERNCKSGNGKQSAGCPKTFIRAHAANPLNATHD